MRNMLDRLAEGRSFLRAASHPSGLAEAIRMVVLVVGCGLDRANGTGGAGAGHWLASPGWYRAPLGLFRRVHRSLLTRPLPTPEQGLTAT